MKYPTIEEIFREEFPVEFPQFEAKIEAKYKTEVARNLLAKGMPIEEIVQVTELPFEKIHALQQKKGKKVHDLYKHFAPV